MLWGKPENTARPSCVLTELNLRGRVFHRPVCPPPAQYTGGGAFATA